MKTTHLRAPAGDIASQHWQGGPVNCGRCCYVFRLPALMDDADEAAHERQARDATRMGVIHG